MREGGFTHFLREPLIRRNGKRMLYHLRVKNLALIDSAEVEFGDGLNILTGETGAGKSNHHRFGPDRAGRKSTERDDPPGAATAPTLNWFSPSMMRESASS